ncbi:MAG TPA: NAD(P)H-dependent oxidoreductase [Kofleriaceae bacterium]|nr:NAD(P)H-dependent oxidoreductase [Kofleriaceae bacterium]
MRRVLVLFAHPVLERSRVNRRLVDAIRGLPGVTVHDLYEVYPTLAIDVAREQALLGEHDAVVFQHPFYWYSTPAILKEWQDLVLELGWAYGPGGTALRGKVTLNAISTGGPEAAYRRDGYNRFTVRELLAPWEQTAHLCGMRFLAPFVVHAALRVAGDADLAARRAAYVRLIEGLRDDRLDLDRAQQAGNLADEVDGLLVREEVGSRADERVQEGGARLGEEAV